jgi:hypothetical protein
MILIVMSIWSNISKCVLYLQPVWSTAAVICIKSYLYSILKIVIIIASYININQVTFIFPYQAFMCFPNLIEPICFTFILRYE